jgi:hypothetical protein
MTAAASPRRDDRSYPWDAVILAMLLVAVIVVLGSYAVDAAWTIRWTDVGRPVAGQFRGTCYWMGDARLLVRIAGNGYSDYDVNLAYRHLTILPDRSWWPVYINLTALALRLTGGDYCSGWWVNLSAMILLPPVIQGITSTRRPLLMVGVALLPFGIWLYAGMAEGTFLLFSGLLLWLSLHRPSERWEVNVLAGIGGLLLGVLVGLTKPNALALIPGFALLGLSRTLEHARNRAGLATKPLLLRLTSRLLDDTNPGWTALLGTLGILIGLGLWFYQTSGYYPGYVLMAQRTLWYKEFDGGNILAFLNYLALGWQNFFSGKGLPDPTPWNMMEFAVLTIMGILIARDLPPRWPSDRPAHPTAVYTVASLLTVFGLMFVSGQAHSLERYFLGDIFFVITFLRYVYGDADEPPLADLPRVVRARGPGALRAALRLAVFACALALIPLETIIMVVYGL